MSYVELTVATTVAAEETVTAALAACDTLGGWVEKPGLFRGYFTPPAADLPEWFRGAWWQLGFVLLDRRQDPDPTFGDVWWSGWFAAPDDAA